jgi:hypothetical protein
MVTLEFHMSSGSYGLDYPPGVYPLNNELIHKKEQFPFTLIFRIIPQTIQDASHGNRMKSWYRQAEKLFDIFQVPTSPLTAGFDADFPRGILPD